jgi:putative multicomponent Na+:H+ antiporter subunit B
MDSYIYVITALLPLVAAMLVFQVNPYHALVIRGILGAVAALVYAVLGAADVALTEALVGTLLAITLYAVAVRSSLVLKLGVLKEEGIHCNLSDAAIAEIHAGDTQVTRLKQFVDHLQTIFNKHHLRVELLSYPNVEDLQQALIEKEVHATCICKDAQVQDATTGAELAVHTTTRLRRLYDIMQTEVTLPFTHLTYVNPLDSKQVSR